MLISHAHDKAKFLSDLGCKDEFTDARWPLPNAKRITETQYWGWRASWSFRGEAWAGQQRIGDEWATLIIFHVDHSQLIGGGFAVLVFRKYREERVEYYEWRTCEHEFSEHNVGHCLHRHTCAKCGQAYDVDSSG